MELTSALPFWAVRNGLLRTYPPLDQDLRCEALVIGGGISGALLAYQLVRRGVDCILVDRREIGHGSTSASTALLQYEIDTPLHKLRSLVGNRAADRAYALGIDSIHRLGGLAGDDCGFAFRPSLQIATVQSHAARLRTEYHARRQLGFPVTFLDNRELRDCGLEGVAGLRSSVAAEVDPYRLTHRLLRLASARGLRVFDRTTSLRYETSARRAVAFTDRGFKIDCRRVCFATGYETRDILPRNIVKLKSTYAFVSEPIPRFAPWKGRPVVWGTGDPYVYFRTTSDNRVLVGGEDDCVLNPKQRDRQIAKKTSRLLRRFEAICPDIALEPSYAWAGVFGSTKDGLGYIGRHPAFPLGLFALGFGGNGITFSEIASQILADLLTGRRNSDENVFRFDR